MAGGCRTAAWTPPTAKGSRLWLGRREGKPETFKIHIGPKPVTGQCILRVGLDQSESLAAARLAVRLNGSKE